MAWQREACPIPRSAEVKVTSLLEERLHASDQAHVAKVRKVYGTL